MTPEASPTPLHEAKDYIDNSNDLPTPLLTKNETVTQNVRLPEQMSVSELLSLRTEIDKLLPATSLSEMNLERELVLQFLKAREMQERVLEDIDTPANQKAQVMNQVASTLQQLIKMQAEYHTSERFKAIENVMIKYMKRLPLDVAEAFIDEYEQLT